MTKDEIFSSEISKILENYFSKFSLDDGEDEGDEDNFEEPKNLYLENLYKV